jgi:plastocyanin
VEVIFAMEIAFLKIFIMKKILLPLLCLLCIESKATTWNVTVENFQFSPASLNVIVGDVIHWKWGSGSHTTSSLSVPAGASSWDAPMTSASSTFDYTITAPGTYTYQCNIHPFQMTGTITATSPLPVTLSVFDIASEDGKPELKWTTLTEINSDYFSIRKSINGKDFKEIAKVPASGNSFVERDYSFTDEQISASIKYVYYALAIVDRDGKTELSPIVVYKNKTALPKLITSLSPNPINGMGHLMLQFNADKPGTMKVKITDMEGRTILKTELSAMPGINNGHIHLGDISSGIYIIYFSLNGITESYRIRKE